MTAQNIGIDNYFVDLVRFSALTPYRAPESIFANGMAKSKKILWRLVEGTTVPENLYIMAERELSRYKNTHYQNKWKFTSPRWQNNTYPYTADTAVCFLTDIFDSYKAFSSWGRLEYYLSSLKLIYIETGIDFSRLELPSLAQLIRYASYGRGSASRYLRLYTRDRTYQYNKKSKTWDFAINNQEYRRLLIKGLLTLYIGSKGIEFKIYQKHNRIRVELALRGRAAVSRFLNSPVSKNEPSRHVSKLADYGAIQHLSSSFLDRLQELLGYLPRGAAEAVNRALASFKTTPMPQAWTIGKKQEPILPLNLFVQKEEPAIDINADRQARAIDGKAIKSRSINKVFLMPFFESLPQSV